MCIDFVLQTIQGPLSCEISIERKDIIKKHVVVKNKEDELT